MIRQTVAVLVCVSTFFLLALFIVPESWSGEMWALLVVSLVTGLLVGFLWGFIEGAIKHVRRRKVILVDMDGVIANWDHAWDEAVHALGERGHGITLSHERTVFSLYHGLDDAQKLLVDEITQTPGFYRHLPIFDGAKRALKEMLDAGYDVRIVTSPWVSNPSCASDKLAWVVDHLGSRWAQRTILTNDKTVVRGDWLFDDKPQIKGSQKPSWEHVIVDAPVNREIADKRRRVASLAHWREVVEA